MIRLRKFGAQVAIGITGWMPTKFKFVTQCYTHGMLTKFVNICGHKKMERTGKCTSTPDLRSL